MRTSWILCLMIMALSFSGCEKGSVEEATGDDPAASADSTVKNTGAEPAAKKIVPLPPKHEGPLTTHPFVLEATGKWNAAVEAVAKEDWVKLGTLLTERGQRNLKRSTPWMKTFFTGTVKGPVEVNGGRIVLDVTKGTQNVRVVAFYTEGLVAFEPAAARRYAVANPGPSAALNRPLSLSEATAGLKGVGQLRVTMDTSRGQINCILHEKRAPQAVANFVGLARGMRGFKLETERSWVKRPFYTGLGFYRVVPRSKVEAGCPLNTGKGGPGYQFDDEFDLTLRHDKPGVLSMANSGPNTNGSRFFLTAGSAPHYNDRNTIFGQCDEVGLVKAMSQAKTEGFGKPAEKVAISGVAFHRKP
jgi:peptidyl-prolyl cis-trans isomerase A (cyclophilin A)